MPARKKEDEPKSFEDAMTRLDAIVAKLEEDKLPLDEMLSRYEEGIALARYCGEKLEAAEQKVRLIARKADGSVTLEDFDNGEET
jgi:exodeoxyribonuclease VII small subunit